LSGRVYFLDFMDKLLKIKSVGGRRATNFPFCISCLNFDQTAFAFPILVLVSLFG
jgi:hypothetical protein